MEPCRLPTGLLGSDDGSARPGFGLACDSDATIFLVWVCEYNDDLCSFKASFSQFSPDVRSRWWKLSTLMLVVTARAKISSSDFRTACSLMSISSILGSASVGLEDKSGLPAGRNGLSTAVRWLVLDARAARAIISALKVVLLWV